MSWNNRGGGMMHNPPFVVPVQVIPKLNDYIPLFTGYALDCITNTAGKNQARAMFKQMVEQDQNVLADLVQALASVVEFYVESEQLGPQQVEAAILNTVEMVVNAYLGMAVGAFPEQFGPLINDQMAGDIRNYIGVLDQVRQQAQAFFNGGQGGGWGRGQQQQNSPRGWQPNAGGRGPVGRGGGGGYNHGGNNRSSRWDEPVGNNVSNTNHAGGNWPGNNQGSGGSFAARGNNGSRASIWDDQGTSTRKSQTTDGSFNTSSTTIRQRRMFDDDSSHQKRVVQPMSSSATVIGDQTFIPARDDQQWPKVIDRNKPWDWILTEDGTQLRPAFKSTWKVTFDIDKPATPWYDPNTHILFHIRTKDGCVTEEPIPREDTMKELDHELDPNLRRKAEAAIHDRDARVAPAWKMVEQLRPNPSVPLATVEPLSEAVEGEKVTLLNPDTYLITTSLADAVKRSCLRLRVDNPELLNKTFEIYVERGVLTTVVNPDFSMLFQMTNAPTFKSLFALMINYTKNKELIDEVDRRMVLGVNQALRQNMGLRGWTIGNFQEDYGDLVAALTQDHGKGVVQSLEDSAIEVIGRWLCHYTSEELGDVRSQVGLDENVEALVWRELSSVTRMPVSTADLNIPVDTGMMVSPSVAPEIYNTLLEIFDRTTDLPYVFHGRYLMTNDGAVYMIQKGYLNTQAVLVYKADFTIQ